MGDIVMSDKFSARQICYCAAACALMAVGAWISVPTTVPFTLQTFAVALVACCLGPALSFWSVFVYILIGAAGVPVFAGFSGGFTALVGPTGGYIAGFVFLAILPGLFEKRWGKRGMAAGLVLGLFLCYAVGSAWFMYVYARRSDPVSFGTVMGWCVVPFLIPDAVKLGLAFAVSSRVRRAIKRR